MRESFFFVFLGAALVAACSSDGSGGDQAGGGGSSSGGASGSSVGAGGSAAGGGSVSGLIVVTCYKPGSKKCSLRGFSAQDGADAAKATCTSDGNMVVDHCPADGLGGCCLSSGVGDCFYDPAVVPNVMSACGAAGTTWSTTAP